MAGRRVFVVVLLILNAVVLLGQLWPEGAPPFAWSVNVVFLCANLIYLLMALRFTRL